MRMASSQFTPCARRERLVVEELPDEVLVYDLAREKAHCLNQTAALVWNRCDGRTTVAELALNLGRELSAAVDEQTVWLALAQLDEARLLRERLPQSTGAGKVTRREALRRVGLAAAVSLPLVTSILVPTAQAQASASADGCLGSSGRPNGCPCAKNNQCASHCCRLMICSSQPCN